MQKSSLCGTKSRLQLRASHNNSSSHQNYKDSTGQKVEIHKSTQFYLYQISHLPVNENSCKTAVAATIPSSSHLCQRNPHCFLPAAPTRPRAFCESRNGGGGWRSKIWGCMKWSLLPLKTYPTTTSTAQLGPWAQGPKMDFREVLDK